MRIVRYSHIKAILSQKEEKVNKSMEVQNANEKMDEKRNRSCSCRDDGAWTGSLHLKLWV